MSVKLWVDWSVGVWADWWAVVWAWTWGFSRVAGWVPTKADSRVGVRVEPWAVEKVCGRVARRVVWTVG